MKRENINFAIMYIVIGIAAIISKMLHIIDNDALFDVGSAFVLIGIIQLVRNIRYKTNNEYKKKIDIQNSDERNIYIANKAWGFTGKITIILLAVASIVLRIMQYEIVANVLCVIFGIETIIYLITYFITSRKN